MEQHRVRTRSFNLTAKLVLAVVLLLVMIFTAMTFLNLSQLQSASVKKGELEAEDAGRQYSDQFQDQMMEMRGILNVLSATLVDARNAVDRGTAIGIVQSTLQSNPSLSGIFNAWEPNAFDGKDKDYAQDPMYKDGGGRFSFYLAPGGDGKFSVTPLPDLDTPGVSDYYLMPKQTKQWFRMNPVNYGTKEEPNLNSNLTAPLLDQNGNFLGVIGVGLLLTDLQKQAESFEMEHGYVGLISQNGSYITNGSDEALIGEPYGSTPDRAALWKDVQAGKRTQGYLTDESGQRELHFFEPLRMTGSPDTWYVETVVPEKDVLEQYARSRLESIIGVIVALILLSVLITLVIRAWVLRPLKQLEDRMKRMAEGDLTQVLTIRTRDEFGRLSEHFNEMTGHLRAMFQSVTNIAGTVGSTSRQLTESAEQTARASETIAESIQAVAAGAEMQNRHTASSVQEMNDMAAGIQRIAESSSQASESANTATEQARLGNTQIKGAVAQMGAVREAVEQSEGAIRALRAKSDEISSIVGMISAISQQTNLLALNAAIEASRVGEHGKGFAVVAAEVRKLADQTQKAAEQVAELIEEVKQGTAHAARQMTVGAEEVRKGADTVSQSGELFASIYTEIEHVQEQITEVSAASEQMSASSQQVAATVEQLSQIASEAMDNASGVAAASEEQLASMEEISSSSETLSRMVRELLDKLSKFKI